MICNYSALYESIIAFLIFLMELFEELIVLIKGNFRLLDLNQFKTIMGSSC